MVSHGCVVHPQELTRTESHANGYIASRNGEGDQPSDLVEWDIVDAKSPNKVIDVGNMLLMRLGCEKGFEEPTAIVNLNNLSNCC